MNLLKVTVIGLSLGVILFFSGCASKATMENMVYKSSVHQQYSPALKESVVVDNVSGGKDTNPIWTSQVGDVEFKDAVKNSLVSEGLYSDNGRYKLTVKINGIDQPLFGLDMQVTLMATYTLVDSKTNKELLCKNIASPYTATFSDSAVGIIRLRLANEGSVRENIKVLLNELAKLKIDSNEVSFIK
jgi:hypothetical protein